MGLRGRARRLVGGRPPRPQVRPHDQIGLPEGATPGPVVTEVFERIRRFPGWFTLDDANHWELLLATQRVAGITGDLLEIGSYHGRSTVMLARHLGPGEQLLICDAFESGGETEQYGDPPTPQRLLANVAAVVEEFDASSVTIHEGLSSTLELPADRRYRFAHIDGGHSYEVALADLELVAPAIVPGGVICLDDYQNVVFPEVTRAGDDFLAGDHGFVVVADLNRHGAGGRKLYLGRPKAPAPDRR